MKFAAIFDMDGVLINTRHLAWRCQKEFLRSHGINLIMEEAAKNYGRPLKYDVEEWNEKYGLSLDLPTYTKILCTIESRISREKGPNKNLVHLLDNLRYNQVPMGVATSSRRKRAKRSLRLAGLREYFPVLVGAEDVHNHKPSPDVFLETSRRLETPPERCIVFENSYFGILAANIAKMKTIGFRGMFNSPEELKEANIIISDFSQVNYDKLSRMIE
jgi:HAD superfamily hydrolase (TIGR01509 family)